TAQDERLAAVLRNLGIASRALPASETTRAMAAIPERSGASITRIDERLRGDRRAQRPVSPAVASVASADRTDSATGEAIRAIVRRIEEFRKVRQPGVPVSPEDAPRLPLGDPAGATQPALAVLDFETDGDGVITWADGDCAPMLVGLPLGSESRDAVTNALIRRRQPLVRRMIVLDGAAAVAGRWQLDATPRFDPPSGRFTSYAGRMRRYPVPPAATGTASPLPSAQPGLDRMRQILHELRNPVGGIQGCAEVMQQAIFGKIPHEYRALGASIAAEAARIMAALDEFERLVKMTGGSASLEQGEADLADVIRKLVLRLEPFSQPRGSGFALDIEPAPILVPFDATAMERLGWRILSVLASCAAPGEVLRLKLRERDGAVSLSVRLPRLLAETEAAGFPSSDMPSPPAAALSSGAFGNVFALRLAAAEARSAGGWLARKGGKLRLVLPGLTAAALGHSQKAG
ncbi:MAG: sensor histidine kinase, partial [Novosphingobium sp.]|nr:sensor histidine kinase [Novosphingobium sp.]